MAPPFTLKPDQFSAPQRIPGCLVSFHGVVRVLWSGLIAKRRETPPFSVRGRRTRGGDRLGGGEGGIRTLGPPQGGQRFSRPPRSTAPAPLPPNGGKGLAQASGEHQPNKSAAWTQSGPNRPFIGFALSSASSLASAAVLAGLSNARLGTRSVAAGQRDEPESIRARRGPRQSRPIGSDAHRNK